MTTLAHRYRVTGTLIPVCEPCEKAVPGLVCGAPIAVDLMVLSTDPRFAAHTAAWQITLGYATWRWMGTPLVTRLEEEE